MMANTFDIQDAAFERRAQRLPQAETWRMVRAAREDGARHRTWTVLIDRLFRGRPAAAKPRATRVGE